MSELYPGKNVSELTEAEKQQVSALSQLASGLAGGLATGNSAGATTGAVAGKTAVDNNLLGSAVRAGEKALASCVKNATCRSGIEQMGIATGLTNAQTEEAMKAGVTRDPEVISKLSPAQIEYLDNQIRSGKGMADIMLGKETWGDRLAPAHTGSNERPETVPNNTGGTETPDTVQNHTGNSDYTETGASHTGNTSDKPDTGGNTTITPVSDRPN